MEVWCAPNECRGGVSGTGSQAGNRSGSTSASPFPAFPTNGRRKCWRPRLPSPWIWRKPRSTKASGSRTPRRTTFCSAARSQCSWMCCRLSGVDRSTRPGSRMDSLCGRSCCRWRPSAILGLPVNQILIGQRDGIEPEMLYRWAGWLRRLTPPLLGLVSIPKWMAGRREANARSYHASLESACRFAGTGAICAGRIAARLPAAIEIACASGAQQTIHLERVSGPQVALLRGATRTERKVCEGGAGSGDRPRRASGAPARVLDVGANEGRFSLLAARRGAEVVAIDSDAASDGVDLAACCRREPECSAAGGRLHPPHAGRGLA